MTVNSDGDVVKKNRTQNHYPTSIFSFNNTYFRKKNFLFVIFRHTLIISAKCTVMRRFKTTGFSEISIASS